MNIKLTSILPSLAGWTIQSPSAIQRAQIRGITGCDDSTIKNVFAKLEGKEPVREPSEASVMRVVDGGKRLGLIVPDTALKQAG